MPTALAAGGVDRRHDLLVDRAGKHHLDHFHGRGVGDPEAVDEARLDIEPLQHLADLGAPAMHHHRQDADLAQQRDVAGEDVGQFLVDHGMAAIFDDEALAGIFLHIGQGVGQGPRRLQPVFGVRNAHLATIAAPVLDRVVKRER
jgi:hypothetical protein